MNYSIAFGSPAWLLLLLAVPFVGVWSRRSLAGLGRYRARMAIAVRVIVLSLIIVALASPRLAWRGQDRTTIFVLDQSRSVRPKSAEMARDWIDEIVKRSASKDRNVGIVTFAGRVVVATPPGPTHAGRPLRFDVGSIDPQNTDIAAGLKLALACFSPGSIKRIVLLSDGNESTGNALTQAAASSANGAAVDVIPMDFRLENEVMVEKVDAPQELNPGDTARIRVVLRSVTDARGALRLYAIGRNGSVEIANRDILLAAGLTVETFLEKLPRDDFYRFEARFEPADANTDGEARNNVAAGFTWVRGGGHILLLEPRAGAADYLRAQLSSEGLVVNAESPEDFRGGLEELRRYDAVIVANVPAARLPQMTQQSIANYVSRLGGGLIMIGGPDSFGAGGYQGTAVEEALPVRCEVDVTQIRPALTLLLVLDVSGSMQGEPMRMAVLGAVGALRLLDPNDRIGVLAFHDSVMWIAPIAPCDRPEPLLERVGKIDIGSGMDTHMYPPLLTALQALRPEPSATKHVIVLTDGQTTPGPFSELAKRYANAGVTISTVGIGKDVNEVLLRSLAVGTHGRYYAAPNAASVPNIFVQETKIVSRPLVFEHNPPWSPERTAETPPVAGLPRRLPAIRGFVLTTPKKTAEIPIRSSIPSEIATNPILAHWQHGVGRSAAFTTDLGERWAAEWRNNPTFAKLWSQLVRWTLRTNHSDSLAINANWREGMVHVVVNAFDAADHFADFLGLAGTMIGPDQKAIPLTLAQSAPGKYTASFRAKDAGAYFISIAGRLDDGSPVHASAGVTVPYPGEYRAFESNRELMENIALVSGGRVVNREEIETTDFFPDGPAPRIMSDEAWSALLLAAIVLFFVDVAVRRVEVNPIESIGRLRTYWATGRLPIPSTPTMQRLRSVKRRVDDEMDKVSPTVLPPSAMPTRPTTPAPSAAESTPKSTQRVETTRRLLDAKRNQRGKHSPK